MKKSIGCLFLVVCLLLASVPLVFASDSTSYGYISNAKVFNSGWDNENVLKIQMYAPDGKVYEADCADEMIFNGTSVVMSSLQASELVAYAEELKNTCIRYTYNTDGQFTGIWYDKNLSEPMQVRYDAETKQFEGLPQSAGLPVYYFYNDTMYQPILSENLLYTVRTCTYGVLIDSYESQTYDYVMHEIAFDTVIDADFVTRSVLVDVALNAEPQAYTLKGMLYQGDILVQEKSAAGSELIFDKLPNAETNYEIVLQLFDQSGNAISDAYTQSYAAKVIEVSFGYVENAGVFSDGWGNETTLKIHIPPYQADCANSFYFNGVRYKNASAQELQVIAEQVKGTYIKYTATEDGVFSRIDTTYGRCEASFENVATDTDKVTGTIAFSKAEAKGTAYVSVFDHQGVLVGLASYTFLADGEDIPFEVPCTLQKGAQYTLKLMLWKDGQKPLSVGKATTFVGK